MLKHAYLDCCLERLDLDTCTLPEPVVFHIDDLAGVPVDTVRALPTRMLRPQLGEHTNCVPTGILRQRPWDDLHRICNGTEWPAFDAGN
jgi:hypothetical protein